MSLWYTWIIHVIVHATTDLKHVGDKPKKHKLSINHQQLH